MRSCIDAHVTVSSHVIPGERPELTDASIEIMAPMDYMVRPPMPPSYVFCIDVSLNSIRSGMLEVVSKVRRRWRHVHVLLSYHISSCS